MCRLMIIVGEHSSLPKIHDYIDSFADSAKTDPYLEAVTHGMVHSHDDGWGYLVISPSGRTVYKSLQPVYNDKRGRRYLEEALDDEWFIAIVHARKAGLGQPKSLENVHPMCVHSPTYGLLCVSHNGTVYKDRIARILGIESMEKRLNDTFFLARLIAGSSNVEESVKRVIESKLVKTAMNTGIAIPDQKTADITVYNVFGYSSKIREKYYRFYRIEGKGFTAYSSSTLVDYYKPEGSYSKITVIPTGSYIEIRRLNMGFNERIDMLMETIGAGSQSRMADIDKDM